MTFPSEYRKGRLSVAEMKWIKENAEFLSAMEIAKHLNRTPDSIKRYFRYGLQQHTSKKFEKEIEAQFNIKAKKYWRKIREQFTPGELDLFVGHWTEIVSQFQSDVIHTESMQIIDLIKLEILCDRCLTQQKHVTDSILNIETLIDDEKKLDKKRDKDKIFAYEQQLGLSRNSYNGLQKEFLELLKKKEEIRKTLRGTREQRFKNIEHSKTNFRAWISQIISEDSLRESLGLEMSKHRAAFEKEKEKLSKPHQYLDKQWDIPLLTHETVSESENS